jgi:uncharacterized protein DUF4249
MSMRGHIVRAAALLVAAGCSGTPVAPDPDRLVVRAYLYAHQPVTDVQVLRALRLGATDTTLPPVTDAEVALVRREIRYPLVPSGDSGYYAAASSLVVIPGDTFDLEVVRGTERLTARTVVPEPPSNVTLTDTLLRVSAPSGTGIILDPAEGITARWTSGAGGGTRLAYVVTQSVDAGAESIRGSSGPLLARRIVNPPTAADSFRIAGGRLTYYGRHVARVYRVNEEYAFLYDTRAQDTRDLNEPRSNVHGGLGIFSAFSSDSLEFVVVKKE